MQTMKPFNRRIRQAFAKMGWDYNTIPEKVKLADLSCRVLHYILERAGRLEGKTSITQ